MCLKSLYPDLPVTPNVNAYHFLCGRPDQVHWPDFTFHVDAKTGEKRTYREFCARVQLGATALGTPVSEGGLGLRGEDGEVIGIIGRNSSDFIVLVHSLLIITTPFALIPIDAELTPFDLQQALESMEPSRIFVEPEFLPLLLSVTGDIRIPVERIYILAGSIDGYRSFQGMIHDVQSRDMPVISPRPAAKDTLAYLLLSSGTTGLPKTIMTSHGNIIVAMQQRRIVMDFEIASGIQKQPDPKVSAVRTHLATLPIFHASGLNEYCLRPFLAPATYVILPKFDPELVLRAIPEYGINITIMWPPRIQKLVNHPLFKEVDLSSLQIVISTASALSAEVARALKAVTSPKLICFNVYGMSEAPSSLYPQPQIAGSYGVLLPGMEARIIRDDGSDADIGEAGELYLRGGSIALAYRNNEEATKEMFHRGWFRTGDEFRVDKNNVFFFAGRKKDMIHVDLFQRVDPTEIENILLSEPQKLITDVCVAGVSGSDKHTPDRAGRLPRAWVVLSEEGRKVGLDAAVGVLMTWARSGSVEWKWLTGGIGVVDKIPRTHSGKTCRRVLQEEYESKCFR